MELNGVNILEKYLVKKKRLSVLVLITILISLTFIINVIPVLAAEEGINSIKIDVKLDANGSAVITEVWDIEGVYNGTEYYIAKNNMDNMNITSLTVWDETGRQYETKEHWNVDESLLDKAYRCGIIQKDNNYEICWGISTYGNHVYTVSYVIEGFVKNYDNCAGFYHRFITDDLSSEAKSVQVAIHMDNVSFSLDNSGIWAYGYDGEIEFQEDGSILAYSSSGFSEGYYLNVLCRFDHSLFPAAVTQAGSFESLQAEVDEEKTDIMLLIVIAVIIIAGGLILVSICVYFGTRVKLADGTRVKIPSLNKVEVRSDIPFQGKLAAIYSAMQGLKQGSSSGAAIGAYLIHWESAGYIRMEEIGKTISTEGAIVFNPKRPFLEGPEARLYEILYGASNEKRILNKKGLSKWMENNSTVLYEWEKYLRIYGENELIAVGKMSKRESGAPKFTQNGFDEAVTMLGLKRYLKEYTAYYEKTGRDNKLWGEYLELATLFGINEQFIKDLKVVDPGYYETYAYGFGCNSTSLIYMVMMANHFSQHTVTAAAEIDGGGGSASFGGGGGFSGGGGGGSR